MLKLVSIAEMSAREAMQAIAMLAISTYSDTLEQPLPRQVVQRTRHHTHCASDLAYYFCGDGEYCQHTTVRSLWLSESVPLMFKCEVARLMLR